MPLVKNDINIKERDGLIGPFGGEFNSRMHSIDFFNEVLQASFTERPDGIREDETRNTEPSSSGQPMTPQPLRSFGQGDDEASSTNV